MTRSLFHDDVIKWKHFRVTGPLCGEFAGHRWMPRLATYCLPNSFTEIWWKWADFHITKHTWSPLCLTHQGRDKLTAIFQTTFWNIFSWVRIYEYCFVFTEVCSFGSNWQYPSIVAWSVPSHCLNQWYLVYWRIYASLSFSELTASLLFYYNISYKKSRLHAWKLAVLQSYHFERGISKRQNNRKNAVMYLSY